MTQYKTLMIRLTNDVVVLPSFFRDLFQIFSASEKYKKEIKIIQII